MKKICIFIFSIMYISYGFSQIEKLEKSNIYIDKDLVVVGVTAKTTDEELLEIRTKLLKFTSIRFTNFDVIREPKGWKFKKFWFRKEYGDIKFISMEVDSRDGFYGKISHSFEKGDKSIQGFYRDYQKNTYNKSFFIGNLSLETQRIKSLNQSQE